MTHFYSFFEAMVYVPSHLTVEKAKQGEKKTRDAGNKAVKMEVWMELASSRFLK